MKAKPLWQVTVTLAPEAEEAATALVQDFFGAIPSVYHNLAKASSTVSVFLSRPDGARPERIESLELALRNLKRFGLRPGPCSVRLSRLEFEDWAESWKKHFRPFTVFRRLLVRPSWSRCHAKLGQVVIELDPGLSFGTGQHPTTRYCLREIVRLSRHPAPGAFLDAGTGSGILAIAAAKLGYQPVTAVDCDPDAVRVARENAARNGVAHLISIQRDNIARAGFGGRRRYRVVCANLTEDLLLARKWLLARKLNPGGQLVLAGILHSSFPEIRRAYASVGLILIRSSRSGEWESGTFQMERVRRKARLRKCSSF